MCLLVLPLTASTMMACSAKPTGPECEAFADHIIDLAASTANAVEAEATASDVKAAGMADPVRQRGEARRAELIERCASSPRTALDCAMAANSLGALRACKR
jgi:hypothetical protein